MIGFPTRELMDFILHLAFRKDKTLHVEKVHVFFLTDKVKEWTDKFGNRLVYLCPAEILMKTNNGTRNFRTLFEDELLPETYFTISTTRKLDKSHPVNTIEIVNELKKFKGHPYYPTTVKYFDTMQKLCDKIYEKHKDDESYDEHIATLKQTADRIIAENSKQEDNEYDESFDEHSATLNRPFAEKTKQEGLHRKTMSVIKINR